MSEIEADIEKWTRHKMGTVISDAMTRCEIAGISGAAMITMLLVELAARAISTTSMPEDEAGKMFVEGITTCRKIRSALMAAEAGK